MRVAFVTTSFPLSQSGVSGIFVARLVEALSVRADITVVAPAASSPGRAEWRGIPICAFRYAPWYYQRLAHDPGGLPVALRKRPWLYLLLPAFLIAMFWACFRVGRKADVIHANWAPTGLVAGLAGLATGVPVVTTIRGEDALRIAHSRMQRLVMRACVRLSRRVICVSEGLVRDLAAVFPAHAGKFEFIPNGVGDGFRAAAGEDTRLRVDRKTSFMILGSLIPRKNVEVALRALALLPSDIRHNVRFIIVGDGPESANLRRCAGTLGLTEAIDFRGAVSPEDVAPLLAQADAMLLCSSSEGRPNAILEGMAAGLPIVASDIPGVRELVRPEVEGLLFAVDDVVALAAHLTRLVLDSALRQRLSNAVRRRIEEMHLTWEAAAERYFQAYIAVTVRAST